MTPAGIKPATFRFVAQHLNHCATAGPISLNVEYLSLLADFNETSIFSDGFSKSLQINFHENPPSGRWTNGQDEPDNRFSQFCERA